MVIIIINVNKYHKGLCIPNFLHANVSLLKEKQGKK